MAARVVVAFTLAVAVACVAWLCWLKAPGLESKRAGHDATDQAVLFDGRAGSEANLESQAASLPAGPPAAGIGDRQAATSTSLVLEGVVLDAVDGPDGGTVPASNTAVYATDGRPFTQDRTTTRTRADGRFRFELQDSGQRPISFRVFTEASDRLREGYASVTLRQVDHAASAITLTRYRRGDLVGVTVDPKGDELAGVMLEFEFGGPPQRIDSDDHGHFRLPNRDSFTRVTATKPGYVLLHADLPVALDTGGTRPLRIVLAQTARLTVRVCDKDKSPLIHYKVRADISPDETYGPVSFSRGMRPLPVSTAAPDGLASFDSVWSGQKLVLTLSTSDTASASIEWIAERELDGDLLFRKDIEGSPIVLDPGVSRELRAVLADSLKLRGRVVDEAGTAAARTAVHLVAANKGSATEAMSLTTRSDENGTFVFEVPSDAAQLVELRAGENSVFGQPVPVGSRIARITIDVSRPPADEIVLVLQPGLSILGRMTGRDGEAVAGQIIVYPHGKDRRSSGAFDYPQVLVTAQ